MPKATYKKVVHIRAHKPVYSPWQTFVEVPKTNTTFAQHIAQSVFQAVFFLFQANRFPALIPSAFCLSTAATQMLIPTFHRPNNDNNINIK